MFPSEIEQGLIALAPSYKETRRQKNTDFHRETNSPTTQSRANGVPGSMYSGVVREVTMEDGTLFNSCSGGEWGSGS